MGLLFQRHYSNPCIPFAISAHTIGFYPFIPLKIILNAGPESARALPVDDAEKFCSWCLSDFEYEGETVMTAPATGFYITPGLGTNQVRMAYVLNEDALRRAVFILGRALEAYPGRKI